MLQSPAGIPATGAELIQGENLRIAQNRYGHVFKCSAPKIQFCQSIQFANLNTAWATGVEINSKYLSQLSPLQGFFAQSKCFQIFQLHGAKRNEHFGAFHFLLQWHKKWLMGNKTNTADCFDSCQGCYYTVHLWLFFFLKKTLCKITCLLLHIAVVK